MDNLLLIYGTDNDGMKRLAAHIRAQANGKRLVNLRSPLNFTADQVEKCGAVLVLGSYPAVVAAYEAAETRVHAEQDLSPELRDVLAGLPIQEKPLGDGAQDGSQTERTDGLVGLLTPKDPRALNAKIFDAETGAQLDYITECNDAEGWYRQMKRDVDGKFVDNGGEAVTVLVKRPVRIVLADQNGTQTAGNGAQTDSSTTVGTTTDGATTAGGAGADQVDAAQETPAQLLVRLDAMSRDEMDTILTRLGSPAHANSKDETVRTKLRAALTGSDKVE